MSGIAYPAAFSDGAIVWASDLAIINTRPPAATCLACGAPVRLKSGKTRAPHFSHAVTCAWAPESVLHVATIELLCALLELGMAGSASLPIEVKCPTCHHVRVGNLARHRGGSVDANRKLADTNLRPDITVRTAAGRPAYVIEVVVTHAPEHPEVYLDKNIPIVHVMPDWNFIGRIRAGFTLADSDRYKVTGFECDRPHPVAVARIERSHWQNPAIRERRVARYVATHPTRS